MGAMLAASSKRRAKPSQIPPLTLVPILRLEVNEPGVENLTLDAKLGDHLLVVDQPVVHMLRVHGQAGGTRTNKKKVRMMKIKKNTGDTITAL